MTKKTRALRLKNYKVVFGDLYPQLCVFAYKYINNLDTAKDIVQETFIETWDDDIVFKNDNHRIRVFYKLVKNKCLNYLKSKQYGITDPFEFKNLGAYDSEDFIVSEAVVVETTSLVEKAINKHPNKAAQVIRLNVKDYGNNEIAEQLDISVNTVKDDKKSAYHKLRAFLGVLVLKSTPS